MLKFNLVETDSSKVYDALGIPEDRVKAIDLAAAEVLGKMEYADDYHNHHAMRDIAAACETIEEHAYMSMLVWRRRGKYEAKKVKEVATALGEKGGNGIGALLSAALS